MKFIKGKWYSGFGMDGNYICKFSRKTSSKEVWVSEYISPSKIYYKEEGNIIFKLVDREVSISEIRHLLPKDYKFTEVNNYYFY